jgi:hypothetical protein
MNVLNEALNGVSTLMPLQKITLITQRRELVKGFTQTTTDKVDAVAHIQPLTPSEVAKIGGGEVLNAKIAQKFYIRGDNAQILSSLHNADTLIEWDGKQWQAYSKDDYSLNGWVKIIATAVQNV